MTLINRPHVRPIVRQLPRLPPLIVPMLDDKNAPFQILPLHITLRPLQPRPRHPHRGSPTAVASPMRPPFDQILHRAHVADRGRDVEGARTGQDAVGAEMQLRRGVAELAEDGEEGAEDLELHAVGAGQGRGGGELQGADLFGFVDEEGVVLVEAVALVAVFEEEFEGSEVRGFDAETEDVEAFVVGGERVSALL